MGFVPFNWSSITCLTLFLTHKSCLINEENGKMSHWIYSHDFRYVASFKKKKGGGNTLHKKSWQAKKKRKKKKIPKKFQKAWKILIFFGGGEVVAFTVNDFLIFTSIYVLPKSGQLLLFECKFKKYVCCGKKVPASPPPPHPPWL